MWKVLLIIVLLYVIFLGIQQSKKRDKTRNVTKEYNINGAYEKKNLLTKAEYSFWKMLYASCEERKLIICPKVRMEDFLSVTMLSIKIMSCVELVIICILGSTGTTISSFCCFLVCLRFLCACASIDVNNRKAKRKSMYLFMSSMVLCKTKLLKIN